jgi:hypothetical protein
MNEKLDNEIFIPRGGAVRSFLEDGTIVQANPGDALYSTVTIIAQEYFDGEKWKPI